MVLLVWIPGLNAILFIWSLKHPLPLSHRSAGCAVSWTLCVETRRWCRRCWQRWSRARRTLQTTSYYRQGNTCVWVYLSVYVCAFQIVLEQTYGKRFVRQSIVKILFWNYYACVCLGAEQDLQIHAAEDNGAHLLCFQWVSDWRAAACQRWPQQHFPTLRKVRKQSNPEPLEKIRMHIETHLYPDIVCLLTFGIFLERSLYFMLPFLCLRYERFRSGRSSAQSANNGVSQR